MALQETRSEQGFSQNGGILRFCTGHQDGHYGIEVWFDTQTPFAFPDGGSPLRFQLSHFQVAHQDPRRMLLRCDTGAWSFWLFAVHAPHSGYAATARTAWWDETIAIADLHLDGDPVFLLGDMNAAPGDADHEVVFRSGFTTSANTADFRRVLCHLGLYLPATSEIHVGNTDTWVNFSGSHTHCIDHIALPSTWFSSCSWSSVLEDFDLATLNDDHKATAVQVQWQDWTYQPTRCSDDSSFGFPIRHKPVDYPSGAEFHDALAALQPLPWHCDNEAHVHHVTSSLHSVLAKLQGKRQLSTTRRHLRRELLAQVFHAWSGRESGHRDQHFAYGSSLRCGSFRVFALYRQQCRSLKAALVLAKRVALDAALKEIDEKTPASQVLRTLRSFTGPTNPKKQKRRTLPIIRDASGEVCTLPADALSAWVHYFQNMEGGERMDYATLRMTWLSELAEFQQPHLQASLDQLPSLTELEIALRRVTTNRASGPDGLPGALCHHHPVPLARLLYAQLAKMILHGEESLEYKGGVVAPIYKGKGPVDLAGSYRSILVSNHIGKALHRTIRQKAFSALRSIHAEAADRRHARSTGKSARIIYLDLAEAFYRVIREVPLGGDVSDDLVAHIMHKLKLPPDSLHQIHALLAEEPALQQAGFCDMDQCCVRAIHQSTHFWLPHQSDLVRTRVGSRPGDCFADLTFGYAWSCVLNKLENQMDALGLLAHFHEHRHLPVFGRDTMTSCTTTFLGPTWMDDLAVCLVSENARTLASTTATVAGLLIDLCSFHCMSPNLSKGKTEAMMLFRGRHSRQAKLDFYGPGASGLLPVKQRIGIGHRTFNQHRKVLFQNPHVPLAKRVEMFNMLVLTKVLYGADSWVAMNCKTMKYFHASILKLHKRLLKIAPDQNVLDDTVLADLEVPTPAELLTRARLRYFGTLTQIGSPDVWTALAVDVEWIGLIESDLVWLWQQLWNTSSLPDPRVNFDPWFNILSFHPGYWKRLIRRACAHAVGQRSRLLRARVFHRAALTRLATTCPTIVLPSTTVLKPMTGTFGCFGCQQRCNGPAGEAAHMFRKHKQRSTLRQLSDEPTCPCCLKHFHTMSKIKAHLHYSAHCRNWLRDHDMRCGAHEGAGSCIDRERERLHDRLLPPLRGQGPLPAPRRVRDHIEIDTALYDFILQLFVPDMCLVDFEQQIRDHVCHLALSWTRYSQTLTFVLNNFHREDAEFFGIPSERLQSVIACLLNPDTWDFMQEHETDTFQLPSLADLEADCAAVELALSCCDWTPGPAAFGRHRYVLHAFSGRRRRDDLQFYLEEMAATRSGYVLHTISLDVIINKDWGDARNQRTCAFWLSAIRDKYIIALVSGPPCESWSQARGVQLTHEDEASSEARRGPRIIRTLSELWGMSCVSLLELLQLSIGNDLLFFTILAVIELALANGVAILEHPAEPSREDAASIWRTPILRAVCALPHVTRIQFAQGLMGSATPKPTALLVVNIPDIMSFLHRGRVRTELPISTAIGKTKQGVWRTTALKEYAPALCRSLACALLAAFDRMEVAPGAAEPGDDFRQLCQTMEVTSFGTEVGADFAPA
eukprot:s1730_g4.t1